jgi:hypothetical protein
MRGYDAVIRVSIRVMRDVGHEFSVCNAITAKFIGYKAIGFGASAFEQLLEEPFRCLTVASFLQKDINDITILINRPPQIMTLTLNCNEHLIHKPMIARLRLASFQIS